MTAAVCNQVEDPLPDWVVAGELMAGRIPPTPPTAADIRLAVWLLLDAGESRHTIAGGTALTRAQVRAVEHLRSKYPADPALAPTEFERMILCGVVFGSAP